MEWIFGTVFTEEMEYNVHGGGLGDMGALSHGFVVKVVTRTHEIGLFALLEWLLNEDST